MKTFLVRACSLILIAVLAACNASQPTPIPVTPTATVVPTPSYFSEDQSATLASLTQVDDYPLYTMRYYGEYESRRTSSRRPEPVEGLPPVNKTGSVPGWGCSLFTVLLDDEHRLFGRNFDWQFSPAILLFTDPPDGYASVSMVDMEYLGFSGQSVHDLTNLPLEELDGLLDAPLIPFDGMNEHGLAIGMAAVPDGNVQPDPARQTIGSLGIMRQILDHARTVDAAVDIIDRYNIDFDGGPPIHYLIADSTGKSVLVEFYRGEKYVITNGQPWHSATNFLRSSVDDPKDGNCWRYDTINDRLSDTQGVIDSSSAMDLLSEVAQANTQWSVVYQMGLEQVSIAMGRVYSNIHTFRVSDDMDFR